MKTKTKTRTIPDYFDPADLREIGRLCVLGAKLNIPVISTRRWPESQVHCAGMFIPAGTIAHSHRKEVRALLSFFHVRAPVILLRGSSPPYVLAHEIGHAAAQFADFIDALQFGLRNPITPLLDRVAARHGFTEYCRSTRRELRAECIGRRLLGQTLPPALRRFTERAWQDLAERSAGLGFDLQKDFPSCF